MSRTAKIERKTAETKIELELNLDGTGQADISTGVGFFDHMLELFTSDVARYPLGRWVRRTRRAG